MKTLQNQLLFLLLIIVPAKIINAQKKIIYPDISFDSLQAKKMLEYGTSTVKGEVFTKQRHPLGYKNPLSPKIIASNESVYIYPVTPYLDAWFKLRKQKEGKTTDVLLSDEARKYMIKETTDADGNFEFTRMKPGKYYLVCYFYYEIKGIKPNYRPNNDIASYDRLITERLEEFIEIKKDREVQKVKLSSGDIIQKDVRTYKWE